MSACQNLTPPAPLLAQELFSIVMIATLVLCVVILLVAFVAFSSYFRHWLKALKHHLNLSIFDIMGMTFRKVPPGRIIQALVRIKEAGIDDSSLTANTLEQHYLAGGNIEAVVDYIIAESRFTKPVPPFSELCALQLAGLAPFDKPHLS